MKEKYTVDWFIAYYKNIPESKWTIGAYEFNGKYCAVGFLKREGKESGNAITTLSQLCRKYGMSPESINDVSVLRNRPLMTSNIFGTTPKERILVVLENIKALTE